MATPDLQASIEEQAQRLHSHWNGSLQYKSDKAAARIDGYDEMSEEEQYELGTAVMRRYCDLLADNLLIKHRF